MMAEPEDKIMKYETGRAKLFLDRGADAILIGDDIAFNTGLLLPTDTMKKVACMMRYRISLNADLRECSHCSRQREWT